MSSATRALRSLVRIPLGVYILVWLRISCLVVRSLGGASDNPDSVLPNLYIRTTGDLKMHWQHSQIRNSAALLTTLFKLTVLNIRKQHTILRGNGS